MFYRGQNISIDKEFKFSKNSDGKFDLNLKLISIGGSGTLTIDRPFFKRTTSGDSDENEFNEIDNFMKIYNLFVNDITETDGNEKFVTTKFGKRLIQKIILL